MTFETMDCEDEARRLRAAFKIESACYIDCSTDPESNHQTFTLRNSENFANAENLQFFPRSGDAEAGMDGWNETQAMVRWDGSIIQILRGNSFVVQMTKAMYCLGLLTTEIEQELNVTILAHQKAEWTLDYAERLEAAE